MKKRTTLLSLFAMLFLPGCSLFPQNSGNNTELNEADRKVVKLTVISKPTKTLYNKGEQFSANGLKLRVVYDDGLIEVIDGSKCSFSEINQTTGEVFITFGGKTVSYVVSFVDDQQQEYTDDDSGGQQEDHTGGNTDDDDSGSGGSGENQEEHTGGNTEGDDSGSGESGEHEEEHTGGNTEDDDSGSGESGEHEDDKENEEIPVTQSIQLVSPVNNAVVNIIDNEVRSYLNDFKVARSSVANDYLFDKDECDESKIESHSARISNYVTDKKDHSKGKSVNLTFSSTLTDQKYYVKVATKADFSDEKTYETSMKTATIYNLYRNKTYYWKVFNSSMTESSSVGVFKTEDAPRMIYTDKLNNVRDYGGYKTSSGKTIKQGLIFRGHELNDRDYVSDNSSKTSHHFNLTDNVKNTLLNELGIKVEFDLRSNDERDPEASGSLLGNSVEYKVINTSSGWCPSYNYISGEKGIYNYKYIKDVFVAIADAAKYQKPIYIHCMGGADRTGSIFFCLGGLLGMNFTDLCAEYEMTSFAKNLRERDKSSSYGSFPLFISGFYDDITSIDPGKTHNIQIVIENLLLKMGITEGQINDILTGYLES